MGGQAKACPTTEEVSPLGGACFSLPIHTGAHHKFHEIRSSETLLDPLRLRERHPASRSAEMSLGACRHECLRHVVEVMLARPIFPARQNLRGDIRSSESRRCKIKASARHVIAVDDRLMPKSGYWLKSAPPRQHRRHSISPFIAALVDCPDGLSVLLRTTRSYPWPSPKVVQRQELNRSPAP